jgi:hypothetical protein
LPRFQKTPIYCLKQKKMKKLVLFFAVIAAVSFASCGNKPAATEATETDTTTVVEEVAADTAAAVADTAVVAQ